MSAFRLAGAALLMAQAAWGQSTIRLKTRTVVPVSTMHPNWPARPASASGHYLVLFGSYPDEAVLAELAARRIQVDAYVPENALMVTAAELDLRGLGAVWFAPMDAADKVSPRFLPPRQALTWLFSNPIRISQRIQRWPKTWGLR